MKRTIITTAVIITLLSVVSGQNDGVLGDGAGVSPSEGEGVGAASKKCEYFEIIIFHATIVYLS